MLRLALPTIVVLVVQTLVGVAETYFVSFLGIDALTEGMIANSSPRSAGATARALPATDHHRGHREHRENTEISRHTGPPHEKLAQNGDGPVWREISLCALCPLW